jgi:hypothetical protein
LLNQKLENFNSNQKRGAPRRIDHVAVVAAFASLRSKISPATGQVPTISECAGLLKLTSRRLTQILRQAGVPDQRFKRTSEINQAQLASVNPIDETKPPMVDGIFHPIGNKSPGSLSSAMPLVGPLDDFKREFHAKMDQVFSEVPNERLGYVLPDVLNSLTHHEVFLALKRVELMGMVRELLQLRVKSGGSMSDKNRRTERIQSLVNAMVIRHQNLCLKLTNIRR